ncbi:CRTAC1 family protein [Paludisphaera mucosa]|uniref:CRTAC1 family protein n=1 Tax=Paludisphaera mucosa TaxID=3030827 RepID=A0ABT6FBZ5_9BACT|nr:CRTAC1 family protein [Paludisphaera mucosa]MDG3004918.1 CRTAC1 family protein [Paludisphaera mucosa]
MQHETRWRRRKGVGATLFVGLVAIGALGAGVKVFLPRPAVKAMADRRLPYQKRGVIDTSGFSMITSAVEPWAPTATLAEIREHWVGVGRRAIEKMEREDASGRVMLGSRVVHDVAWATLLQAEGDPVAAGGVLAKARALAEADDALGVKFLPSLVYFQGVAALRRGENDNCVMCRGDSSCILPISKSARHKDPTGSKAAIGFFTELLEKFPDDLEAMWLLNIAHMTLGQYPDGVDPRFRLDLDRYVKTEFDIGRFRDVGQAAGVNRYDQAGGAIMEDFDGDGLLDLFMTSFDPKQAAGFFRNKGDGTFEDRGASAGLAGQYGGLYCVQADYDGDGLMDVFIPRGAWLKTPMRPSLLKNQGGGVFVDATDRAGLAEAMNSNSAAWADYDNDGDVDLFVCEERRTNRLYRNKGDGAFEDATVEVGLADPSRTFCKGACWVDFDNDGDPDLFASFLNGLSQLYRNDGGEFVDATEAMGVRGPMTGFSCWAFDYDNDGWVDVFATCYDRSLGDVVKGLLGRPHGRYPNRLYRNVEGRKFVDETRKAGLDMCFSTMGSNFADFDNDGFLDFYLGTGEPSMATLIPNRMFKNVEGRRFSEVTGSAGVGHLQKGHAVACGDYDRDGDVDLFAQTGGAVDGDRYHNVLFQNPGQGRRSLTIKLVGVKTNRAAIGARIKVVSAGPKPQAVHRTVGSGSSFGANALEQTIGLADAEGAALIEVYWPTSKTTQTFRDVPAGRVIEITEFAADYRTLDGRPQAVALRK